MDAAKKSYKVHIINLGHTEATFSESAVTDIGSSLGKYGEYQFVWLGHDDKTGPLALQLRDTLGGQAALIHHMAHGAYQGYKKCNSNSACFPRQTTAWLSCTGAG